MHSRQCWSKEGFAAVGLFNSILEKADFRTSYNYSIDADMNRMKKAKFSSAGISGLLDKYDIEIELYLSQNF